MKNIILITFLFLLCGCGYTAVYKDKKGEQNFQIAITEMKGDKDMNNLIKNQLNLYSNKNSTNKYNITIDSDYKKTVYAKDSAGVATNYQISVNSVFTIFNDQESQKFNFNEKINIKNQTDTFNQNSYENNIKKNFASALREKLISKIIAMR